MLFRSVHFEYLGYMDRGIDKKRTRDNLLGKGTQVLTARVRVEAILEKCLVLLAVLKVVWMVIQVLSADLLVASLGELIPIAEMNGKKEKYGR